MKVTLFLLALLLVSLTTFGFVKVVAVGDVMPGSTFPTPLLLPDKKMEEIAKMISSFMPQADIRLFNLEGTLIDYGKPAKKGKKVYHFAIPTRSAKYLKMMGFNVACINNNHIMDFGWEPCLNTINTLESNGIKCTGLRGKIAEFVIGERQVCVIAFGYTHTDKFYSILDIKEAKEIIKDLKKRYDIVIVSYHGGQEGLERVKDKMEEYLEEKRGNLVAFSRGVIDAGADLVIGHGPHIPRALELYKGKLIAYSLGNFFTYGRFSIKGAYGYAPMLYVVLDERGNFKEGRLLPFVQLGKGIPFYDKEGKAIRWIERMTKLDFPFTPLAFEEGGRIRKK